LYFFKKNAELFVLRGNVAARVLFYFSSDVDMATVGLAHAETPWDVVVAVRQGALLATAFHPEFTADPSWHKYFLRVVAEATAARNLTALSTSA
jgi:glutamine amidotransferase PdxT